jgi:hypothetical protein
MLGANSSLGGTSKNHLKEWLKNQKWPNHFPRLLPLNVFHNYNFFLMFIHCMP